jgi:anti-sigma factor RsiW
MRGECERIQELLVDRASGELDAARRAVVEEHLTTCPECADDLASLERTFAALRNDGYEAPSPFYWTRFDAALRRRIMAGRAPGGGRLDWSVLAPRLAPAAVALFCFAAGVWIGLRPAPEAAGIPGIRRGSAAVASYDAARTAPVISPESKLLVESGLDGHPVYAADTLRPNALAPFGEPPEMVLAASPRLAIVESGLGQRSLGR